MKDFETISSFAVAASQLRTIPPSTGRGRGGRLLDFAARGLEFAFFPPFAAATARGRPSPTSCAAVAFYLFDFAWTHAWRGKDRSAETSSPRVNKDGGGAVVACMTVHSCGDDANGDGERPVAGRKDARYFNMNIR